MSYKRLLDVLDCNCHDNCVDWSSTLTNEELMDIIRLAHSHKVLPILAEVMYRSSYGVSSNELLFRKAKKETILQARKTAAFLDLYQYLNDKGLYPLVLKGIICRSLYPNPEQRSSVDEDLFISPEEFGLYHKALTDYGLITSDFVKKPSIITQNTDTESILGLSEVSYFSENHLIYIELHNSLFPKESASYGNCNHLFAGARSRSISQVIYGVPVYTLGHTDHLLYMICHAYKHFLHGGVGIRQICDIGLYADKNRESIDWKRLYESITKIHIEYFTNALFTIVEKHLGMHICFNNNGLFVEEIDEIPLLMDILSGGLYGVKDINRAHSANMTLDAVSAQQKGRNSKGILKSLFPTGKSFRARYPYLERFPWLFPLAWGQRLLTYLSGDKSPQPINPAKTIRIGHERIELLKKYKIID